jgi:hypothetical protein
MADRPTRRAAEPAGEEIEVTPEMIEEGVGAYYANAVTDTGLDIMRDVVREVYIAMAKLAPTCRPRGGSSA